MDRNNAGFTLIELLIVVAIIGILAAIAIPNFLQAQTRAKVARTKADMGSIATALEAYSVDYNKYPPDGINYPRLEDEWRVPNELTTPLDYITSVSMPDPFRKDDLPALPTTNVDLFKRFEYVNFKWSYLDPHIPDYPLGYYPERGNVYIYGSSFFAGYGAWRLTGFGPDKEYGPIDPIINWWTIVVIYDPTNGTMSRGDIVRCHKFPDIKTSAL
jgi:type II secretion system protein G